MDLGKTITGTFKETYDSAVLTSGELSNSYIKDFYGNSSTKEASDAIFIVTEPFFTPDDRVSSIASFVITPDNKVFYTIATSWGSNPET